MPGYNFVSEAMSPEIAMRVANGARLDTIQARRFRQTQLKLQERQVAVSEMNARTALRQQDLEIEYRRDRLKQAARKMDIESAAELRRLQQLEMQQDQFEFQKTKFSAAELRRLQQLEMQQDQFEFQKTKFVNLQNKTIADTLNMVADSGGIELQEGEKPLKGHVEFVDGITGKRFSVPPQADRILQQKKAPGKLSDVAKQNLKAISSRIDAENEAISALDTRINILLRDENRLLAAAAKETIPAKKKDLRMQAWTRRRDMEELEAMQVKHEQARDAFRQKYQDALKQSGTPAVSPEDDDQPEAPEKPTYTREKFNESLRQRGIDLTLLEELPPEQERATLELADTLFNMAQNFSKLSPEQKKNFEKGVAGLRLQMDRIRKAQEVQQPREIKESPRREKQQTQKEPKVEKGFLRTVLGY